MTAPAGSIRELNALLVIATARPTAALGSMLSRAFRGAEPTSKPAPTRRDSVTVADFPPSLETIQ